jgi:hypothetical protein
MGLCRKAREARVTETVPANPVMNGATNPITTALPTGTGWQAAPAAGARTTEGERRGTRPTHLVLLQH